MNQTRNSALTSNSKKLRREMTKEERHLWYDFLKQLGVTVHRQKVIGPYIVDFYCARANLVIELDGSQHYDDEALAKDRARDRDLYEQGFTVLRFSHLDIARNFTGVCQEILKYIPASASRMTQP